VNGGGGVRALPAAEIEVNGGEGGVVPPPGVEIEVNGGSPLLLLKSR